MKIIKLLAIAASLLLVRFASAQETFKVGVAQPEHAVITVTPAIPADSIVAAGTKLNVKIDVTDPAWAVDCGYISVKMGRWARNTEFMSKEFSFEVTADVTVNASIISASRLSGIKVINDVVFAKPGKKALKYDVFMPENISKPLPGVIIIHGGGWNSNCEDVMRGLGRAIAQSGRYIAFSIDYRWIAGYDGDENPTKLNNILEDVYGAILFIQEHAAEYGLDPTQLAVTGDSAGGQLSAQAAVMVEKVGNGGFGVKEGVYEFLPTYIPKGMDINAARESLKAIKAAAPSYGVFALETTKNYIKEESDEAINANLPTYSVPSIKVREIPFWLTRGSSDFLIKLEEVKTFQDALAAAGQRVEYVEVPEASHAFFDWKCDQRTQATWDKFGVPYTEQMVQFYDSVFYKK